MQKLSTPYIHVVLGLDWAQQLINPLNVVRCSLRENYHDDLSALFVKYWAFPIVLTFAANAVVFHIYNIEKSWLGLSEQFSRFDKWNVCRV
jgi:hypothetical protein